MMEFIFHGTNHVQMNEILCNFYTRVRDNCNKQIENTKIVYTLLNYFYEIFIVL